MPSTLRHQSSIAWNHMSQRGVQRVLEDCDGDERLLFVGGEFEIIQLNSYVPPPSILGKRPNLRRVL